MLLAQGFLNTLPLDPSLANEIIGNAAQSAQFASLTASAASLDPRILMANIMRGALLFVGLIFLARMVYAGFLWFSAQGESEPIKKAQKILTQSSLGAVLLFASFGIAQFLHFQLVNALQENILDELTTCGSSAGVCCQEWANFQNSSSRTGFTNPANGPYSSLRGQDPVQRKLYQDWQNCRSSRGSWTSTNVRPNNPF